MGLKHKPQEIVSVNQNKKISLPGRVEELETEEFIDFARNSIEINPEKVIEDCNHLHSQIGIDYRLYALAGEAYINCNYLVMPKMPTYRYGSGMYFRRRLL